MKFTIHDLRWTRAWQDCVRIVVCAFGLLALSLLVTSCHRHDVQMSQQISGNWQSFQATNASSVMHIDLEGDFRVKSFVTNGALVGSWNYGGLWEVHNGVFVALITNSLGLNWTNFEAADNTNEYKVIALDDSGLVWDLHGQTTSWYRR